MCYPRLPRWIIPIGLIIASLTSSALAQVQLGLAESPAASGFFSTNVQDSITATGSGNAKTWLFEAEGGDRVTVWVVADSTDSYPRLRLRNAGGTTLAANDGTQQGESWIQNFNITTPGSYTLVVYSDNKATNYRMRVDVGRGFALESEGNDSLYAASILTINSNGSGFTTKAAGALRFDADYYDLGTLGAGNAVNISLGLPTTSTLTTGDLEMTVFKKGAEGTPLATTTTATLNATATDAGDYFLRIRGIDALSGRALRFDGSDDGVNLGNPSALQITGDQTIEMWVKPDDFAGRRNPWNKAYAGEGTMTIETNGDVNYFYGTGGADNNPYQGVNCAKFLRAGFWNHIALVRKIGAAPRKVTWFINGRQTNEADAQYFPAVAGALNALIGTGYAGRFKGEIDELRVWNVARTAAEISANFGNTLVGNEAGLVAYYKFAEGGGTVLDDATANSIDGTISGSPVWTGNEGVGTFTAKRLGLLAQYVATISVTDATAPTVTGVSLPPIYGHQFQGVAGLLYNPGNMTAYRGQNGTSFNVQVTAGNGSIWGTDVYTDDSSVAVAAMHAGLLAEGETGIVTVTILAGQSSYVGTPQNGVSSNSYTSFPGSYSIAAYTGTPPTLDGLYNTVRVNFSERMLPSTLQNAANVELRHAGANGTFGDLDDYVHPLTTSYTGMGTVAYFNVSDGPLQPGLHRLRVTTSVTDRSGNPLAAVSDTTFTILSQGSFVSEGRSNNSKATATSVSLAPSAGFDRSFTYTHDLALNAQPHRLKLLDLTGDGRLDAVVAMYYANEVRVFAGNADGSFASTSTNYATGTNPTDLELIDFDSDGDQDVVVLCYGSDQVRLHRNDIVDVGTGARGLVAAGSVTVGDGPTTIAKADINGDSRPDLVVSNYETGTGGRSVSILLGNVSNSFTESKVTVAGNVFRPYGVAAGDVNGDGFADLVAADFDTDGVRVFLGNGDGTFGTPANFDVDDQDPTSVRLADFDHDGKLDVLVTTEYHNSVSILKNNGNQGAGQPASFSSFTSWYVGGDTYMYFGDIADLDGDGWVDLVIPSYYGLNVLYNRQSTAAPSFTAVQRYEIGYCLGAAVADVNGDGRTDIVVNEWNSSRIRTLLGNAQQPLAVDATVNRVRHGYGRGQISSGSDEDWFSFTVGDAKRMVLAVENPGTSGAAALYYAFFNSNGTNIYNFVSEYNGHGESAQVNLDAPGTYYVRVTQYYEYRGEYQFRISLFDAPTVIESESNDSIGAADGTSLALGVGSLTGTSAGYISEIDPTGDYWGVGNLGAGANITLDLRIPATSPLSARMAIYKADGTQMAISTAGAPQLTFAVTAGNESAYYFRVFDGASTRGLHSEYLVDITIADPVAPTITSVTLPAEGASVSYVNSYFTAGFSEDMLASTVNNGANYELRNAGPNGTFGNGDDQVYTIAPQSYSSGLSATYHIPDGPLQPGNYRFTISTGLTDKFANPLASAYTRLFTVVGVPGFVLEDRSNNNTATADSISVSPNSTFDGSFSFLGSTSGGDGLWGLKLIDLNGDGNKEAIAARYNAAKIAVFPGNADGTFGIPVSFDTGANPWDIELIDFDGDLDTDGIAVSCYGSDQVRIYTFDNGALVPGAVIPVGDGPVHMVKGKFNNDSFPDLAVANFNTGTGGRSISLLLGNGTGGFTESKITVTGQTVQIYGLGVGDFNEDGLDDLAATDYGPSDDVMIFTCKPAGGTFEQPQFFAVDDSEPTGVGVADFDHDGNLDLVVCTEYHDYVSVLKGNGNGSFQPYVRVWTESGNYMYFAETPDLNGDGWADLVVSKYNGIVVLYNRADGTLNFSSPIRHGESSQTAGAAFDDVNHDGRVDVIANSYDQGRIYVWTGNPSLPLANDGAVAGMRHGAFRGFLTTDSDEDWYVFTAQDQDRMLLTTESPGAPGSSGRYYSLFNSQGVNLSNFVPDYTGYGQWSYTLNYAGRYYIRVTAYWGGTQEYRARVSLARPPVSLDIEDNDSLSQMNTPPLVLSGGQLTGTVFGASVINDPAGDYFNLGNLSPGTQVTLTVSVPQMAADGIAARQAMDLKHRWSFGESAGATTFTDSISGNPTAILRGSGATVGGGQVVLPGGAPSTAPYIDLPNGLASSRTASATIEGWATINGSQSWSRLFDFGTTNVGEILAPGGSFSGVTYFYATAQNAGTLTNNNVGLRTPSADNYTTFTVPYTAGQQFHFAVVYDTTKPEAKTIRYYRNGAFMGSFGTSNVLVDVGDYNDWLGRSQFTSDGNLNGAYSEFRVWDGAHTDAQVAASATAGPDALPSAVSPLVSAQPYVTLYKSNGTQMAAIAPGGGPLTFTLGAGDTSSYGFRVFSTMPSATALYLVNINIADVTPPTITSNSLPAEGSTVTFPYPDFSLGFSEDMKAATVNSLANYELRNAGANNTFGDGDDQLYALSLGGYSSGLSESLHIVNGPLQPGNYRFTAGPNLKDLFDQPMAAAHVRQFTVVGVPGFVTEDRDNGSQATADILSGAAGPGAGFDGSYAAQTPLSTGGNAPISVLLIDLDGDNDLDLVVSNRDSDTVTTRLNVGSGVFGPLNTPIAVGDGPHYMCKIDIDKDGDDDVVVPNAYSDNVTVLRNDRTGTLITHATLPGGDHPLSSAKGDFNGDGNPDFVVTDHETGAAGRRLSLYLGDGLGGFVHSYVGVGLSPSWRTYHVTVADFDGNSLDDIAAVNYDGNDVLVFLATGAGNFAAPVRYPTDRGNPTGIAVADFNGDFKPDLVVCYDYYDRVNILLGKDEDAEGKRFAPYQNWYLDQYRNQYNMRVGDLNGDGYPDLLAPRWGALVTRQNKATPTLNFNGPAVSTEPYLTIDANVADLNGDGRRDIVALSHDQGQVWVYLGQGPLNLAADGAIAGMRHGYGRGQLDVNGEIDYFTFSARGGEKIVVAAETVGSPGSSGFQYRLFNQRGDNVANTSQIYYEGYAVVNPYTVAADGRYFLRIEPYWWSTTEYRFRVSIVDAQTQVEAEDNNSIGQANTLTFSTGSGTRTAKVFGHHAPNDGSGDYFRLGNLAGGTDVTLSNTVPQAAIDAAASRQPLVLRHRWSFSESAGATTFADSVGSTTAELKGTGATVGGGTVTLPGGNYATTAYVDLPNGILSARTGDATIEGWVTVTSNQSWGRLFEFGTNTAGEITSGGGSYSGVDSFILTGSVGSGSGNRLQIYNDQSVSNYVDVSAAPLGQPFHYAVSYDADGNGTGHPALRYYRNGVLITTLATNIRLTDITDVNNWLGRSNWSGEGNLSGVYNEFRVWDGAFTDSEAIASYTAGPDALPSASPAPIAAQPILTLYKADGTLVATAQPGSGPLHHIIGAADSGAYFFRVWHSARNLNSVYQINAALTDALPPQVTGTDLPDEGSSTLAFINAFSLTFNEDLLPSSVATAANYQLKEAGADTVIGSSDDVSYTVSPAAYSAGLTNSYSLADPLPPGTYRLTVSGLKDVYGTQMTGAFTRNFVVSQLPGFTTASTGNNTSATATPLLQVESPAGLITSAGRGRRTSSGDTDFWSFNGTTGQKLTFDSELVGGPASWHLYWYIRRPNGTVLWEGINGIDNQGTFVPVTLNATGTYTVQVSEYNGWYSEYRFRLSLIDPTQLQLESEANNTISVADPVTLTTAGGISSAKVTGIVHTAADLDYFNLGTIPAGKTVFLSATLPPTSPFLPVVAVYNSSGVFMSEVNGSPGDGSAEVRINSPDTYYLLVRGTGGTGSYMSQYVTEVQIHETSTVVIPNLQVTAVALPPESGLQSGSAYTYSFTVTNVGSADIPAQAWSDRLVLSQNEVYGDSDDVEVGVFPRNAALAAGASYDVPASPGTANLPAGLVGNYRLIARTDIADQVDELVLENDNTRATATTFPVALAPYPNIVVQNLQITGPVSDVFTINWTLANTGNLNAGSGFKERVRVINTSTGTTLLDELRTPGALNAGDPPLARSAEVTTNAAGVYQVTVIGDANNDLFEHDGTSHANAEVNTATSSFNILQYWTIAVSTPDASKGSVSGGGTYLDSAPVTVTATPNTSSLPYQFVRWTQGGNFVSANASYTFTASANRTLVAEFALATYQVAATVSPAGTGTVSGAGFYQHGSTATLTATPGPGYLFGHWEEGGSNVGTNATLQLTVNGNRTVQAFFSEANPTHVVTTATSPAGLGTTTGDGTFNNSQSSNFSASATVEQGDTEYLFDHWTLNGAFFGNTRLFSKTFSTLDNANMAFVAHYTSRSLKPVVTNVTANYGNPFRAANDVKFTLTFDRAMNQSVNPVLVLNSANAPSPATIPAGGTWLTNTQFQTANTTFGTGNGGAYTLNASAATDTNGRVMAAANVYAFDVDVTPPANPVLALTSSTGNSATVNWNAYSAPADINGFRLYLQTSDYVNVSALLPVSGASPATRTFTFNNLQPDTNYYASVVAVDVAGNADPVVTTLTIFLDSTVPPPVTFTLTTPNPETARLNWAGYNTSSLIGFQGFRIYREEAPFNNVTGLTAVAQVAANVTQHDLTPLDRTKVYYLAVVGYNHLNEFDPAVTTKTWSDPLSGNIISDLTIGTAGSDTIVNVLQTMTVKPGATLTILPGTTIKFAAGKGLTIEGALVANGTPLRPINLTSAAASPVVGDWDGLRLTSNTNATHLTNVWIRYGKGLTVAGGQPDLGAVFAVLNQGQGLLASGNANISVENGFFSLNDRGIVAGGTSSVAATQTVIKNNVTRAAEQTDTATLTLAGNWWGTTNAGEIAAGVTGTVDTSSPLSTEPVLATGLATAGGITSTGSRNLGLVLASANATAYRLSENSLFPSVLWTDIFPVGETNTFSPYPFNASFLLSAGGGLKTVYAQFRSITGGTTAAIPVNITLITDGPTINAFNLTDGQTITRPITVTGSASAPLGMQHVQFLVDDALLAQSAGGSLNFFWDVRSLNPGPYRAKLLAQDSAGNTSTREVNVNIAPAPPPAPVITVPANNTVVNTNTIAVTGTAEPGVTVRMNRNGSSQGTQTATGGGAFSFPSVSLVEGVNELIAVASDSVGSRSSAAVNVTLDSGPPAAVVMDEPPVYDPFHGLQLTWHFAPSGERPVKYKVYWHNASFATPAQASGQSALLVAQAYTLTSAPDGPLFIGVVGYDDAGNASALSNLVSYTLDRAPPSFTLAFDKSMPAGPGALGITLTANEPLAATPLLTIRPNGMPSPISVTLSQVSGSVYTATYNVTNLSARTGAAVVNVAGSDTTGNQFSGAPGGTALSFDVTPPTATLTFDQPAPIKTVSDSDPTIAEDVNLSFNLTLSELPKAGTIPSLTFTPPIGAVLTPTLTGSGLNWTGSLVLTASMGKGFGQFVFSSLDLRNNTGSSVTPNQLEIYNTEHPAAPGIPVGLQATTLSGGRIKIDWGDVSDAQSYRIFREPGNTGVTPTVMVAENITQSEWIDETVPVDGIYRYAVRAFRVSIAGSPSGTLNALSDRTPPNAPENPTVVLGLSGVAINWVAPSTGQVPAKYHVYRNGTKIRSVTTPQQVLDFPPRGLHQYEIAAADTYENESRTAPIAFEFFVDAVANLKAVVREGQPTVVTWQFSDSAGVGYNVYRNGVKQNSVLIPVATKTFTDNLPLPPTESVEYRITGVDNQNREGAPRTVRVLPVAWSFLLNLDATGNVNRAQTRYFDDYFLNIVNNDATRVLNIGSIEVNRTLSGGATTALTHQATLNIAAGDDGQVNVPVPGAQQPSQTQTVEMAVVTAPNEGGATVSYVRSGQLNGATEPGVMLALRLTDTPFAGGLADVKVRIHNSGYAPADIILGRQAGQQPGDLVVQVRNEDGVEVSRKTFNGVNIPAVPGLVIRPNGDSVVTLAVGASVEVTVDDILVPIALAESGHAQFYAEISQIRTGLGTANERVAGPLTGSLNSNIIQTPYYGSVSTDFDSYSGNQAIVINGQSIDRSSGNPQGNLAMRIGFAARGAVWYQDITSDANGNFSYSYTPFSGFAGELTIWATHPAVFDVLAQKTLKIYRLYVTPSFADIRMSKNDHLDFTLGLINPADLPLTGVDITFRAYKLAADNVTEIPVPEITCDFQDGVGPGSMAKLGRTNAPMRLVATAAAPDNAIIEITYITNEGASVKFKGNVELLQPVPILSMTSPAVGYVDVTVNRGQIVSREVTLKNLGTRALEGVELIPPASIPWMQLNLVPAADGNIDLPDIPVGGTVTFTVAFVPPPDHALGYFNDKVKVRGSNHVGDFEFNLWALVSSSATGNASFHVANFLGQDVPSASVRMKNTITGNEIGPFQTNADGETTFNNLTEGTWAWQVIAAGHSTKAGTIDIVAAQTVSVEVELTRSLVTVTFQVKPVPFTDRYEIVIEQTFLTFVPAPVLVMTPPKYEFGNVQPGFETTVIYELKNHGLIKCFDVTVSGTRAGIFTLEPLIDFIPELLPQQVVQIPARVKLAENIYASEAGGCGDGSGLGGFTPPLDPSAPGTFGGPAPTLGGAAQAALGESACPSPSNLADFLNGLAAIASLGANGCYQSQQSGHLGTVLAVALAAAVVYQTVTTLPAAEAPIISVIAGVVADLLQCIAGHFSAGGGGGGSGGGGGQNSGGYGAGGNGCFTGDTPVALADGRVVHIDQLRPGDVLQTGIDHRETAEIREVYELQSEDVRLLQLRGETGTSRLRVTGEHMIWKDGAGWTAARDLEAGDWLHDRRGNMVEITAIEPIAGRHPVYTLQLKGNNTFYAGGVLVQDLCGGRYLDKTAANNLKPVRK